MKTKQNKKQNSGLSFRPEQHSGENNSNNNTATSAPAQIQPQAPPVRRSASDEGGSTNNSQLPKRVLPYVNYQLREANRALGTEEVLNLLRQWLPAAYDLAEIVGKWVWITFPDQPAEQVRGQLSQFGFHWNNVRKCWQHPCGQFTTTGTSDDPREKYGSHFAADLKAA